MSADLAIDGATSKGLSLELTIKDGEFNGSLTAADAGQVVGGDVGGSLNIGGKLASLTIKGGDLTGDLTTGGPVGAISVSTSMTRPTWITSAEGSPAV